MSHICMAIPSSSGEQIDGVPSWLVLDGKDGRTKKISYYDVAGWSSPEVDYPLFERAIRWLIVHWPGKR